MTKGTNGQNTKEQMTNGTNVQITEGKIDQI